MKRALVVLFAASVIAGGAPTIYANEKPGDKYEAVPLALESYELDPGHSSVNFRISHLGISAVVGRFNELSGKFTYNPGNPSQGSIEAVVKTASIDTNHAERDKHLRSKDFLNVDAHPEAKFVSTGITVSERGLEVKGDLTLNGVTRPILIVGREIGAGLDPWGGYRRGFEGSTSIALADYGINYDLGQASKSMVLVFILEGIRK